MKKLKSSKPKSTISDILFIIGFVFFLYSLSAYDLSLKKDPPAKIEASVHLESA
jgi:hypothetical protein